MGPAQEWRYLRAALIAVGVLTVVVCVGWKVHDLREYKPTRLELTLRCLNNEKGVQTAVPAADPLAASAGDGSLQTMIEGNGVTEALASSEEQAIAIEQDYGKVATGLEGRLERRGRVIYLWLNVSSPTQRQVMYDCAY